MLCLENLFIFLDYIAHCYTENSTERTFDKNTITARMEKARESKVAAKNIREELEKEQEKSARQELDLKNCRKCFIERRTICTKTGTAADLCSKTS